MFKRAKVLLPASRRAARAAKDLAEREEIEIELEAAFRSKMVVWGVLFTGLVLVMVLGMALLARRWSKRQAHRESALNHALEESRAETAAATDKTTMAEAKKEVSAFPAGFPAAYTSGQAGPAELFLLKKDTLHR